MGLLIAWRDSLERYQKEAELVRQEPVMSNNYAIYMIESILRLSGHDLEHERAKEKRYEVFRTCNVCARPTWNKSEFGKSCGIMTAGSTERCPGQFISVRRAK